MSAHTDNERSEAAVDVPRLVRLGDYVHAAKYSDYDPADPWRIGFVVRIIETWKPHPTLPTEIKRTYVIGEQDGTWSDFREYNHAKRITAEEGKAFLEANDEPSHPRPRTNMETENDPETASTPPTRNGAGVDDRRLVRLCVNCAHHTENVCRENVCMRKNRSKGVDPVTGKEIKTGGIYCDRRSNMIVARLFGECGKEGRFFKPNAKADARQTGASND